jgi:hypothetical protein
LRHVIKEFIPGLHTSLRVTFAHYMGAKTCGLKVDFDAAPKAKRDLCRH